MLYTIRHRAYALDHLVAVPGYIDKEHRRIQYFVRDILLFGHIPIHTKVLFKEHVPNWAWIQQGTCGWCEWRSDAPQALWDLCVNKSQVRNRV